jgi:hypothetical protein
MKLDPYGANTEAEYAHYLSHIGALYSLTDYAAAIAIATPKLYQVKTGANELHLEFAYVALTSGLLEFADVTGFTTDGSPLVPLCYNRKPNFAKPLTVVIYKDPTVPAGAGTSFFKAVPAAYNVAGNRSGFLRDGAEFNLAPNSRYLFRFTTDADGNKGFLTLSFYEPPLGGFKG